MQRILSACALLAYTATNAQDITGFLDYRDHFFVFDQGTIKELEVLPPRAFATGGGSLIYASTGGDVKVYRNGEATTIDQGIATKPFVTDYYFGYVSAGTFKIYDGKELKTLSTSAGAAIVEDSIAAFYDDRQRTLSIYYNGNSEQVEDALMESPVQSWSAGDNTIAWISKMTREFKVYYRGEIQVLATLVTEMPFTAGLDMVAYQDPSDKGLKIFFKGEVIDQEAFMPEKMQMGKGLFAYVDMSGALKVFQNGTTYTALDFTPEEFFVKDSLVVIHDKDRMKVFHNGTTTEVLTYFPQRWRASWGTLAWLDVDGTMKAWRDGKTFTVMQREPVKDFSLDRGLISVSLTNNAAKVWWKGKVYDH